MKKLNGLTRREFAVAGLATIAATGLMPKRAAAADTIKVGVFIIDSGPWAAFKESHIRGLTIATDMINSAGGINGKKVETVSVTYAGTPDSAVQTLTRLAQAEKINLITGMFSSSIALALSARCKALNVVLVDGMSQSDAQTGDRCSKNYFRTGIQDAMSQAAFSEFLKTSGTKSWDILAVDYSLGHDSATGFKKLLSEQGMTLGKELYNPVGTPDFGTYISQLADHPAEGLMLTIFGGDSINFAKQQQQFGLLAKYKDVLSAVYVTPPTLQAQGDGAVGVHQMLPYVPAMSNPRNDMFVAAYKKAYGEEPDYPAAEQFAALDLLAAALRNAKSTETAAVIKAFETLKTDSIYGPVEMRAADHQLIRPITMNKVIKEANGKPAFKLEKIYPGSEIIPPVSPKCSI